MLYGLIGEHLGHSFSREIHGRLSSDPYELCELAPSELASFLQRRDFRGINVTIPYKQAVMPYLDELGESARGAGAVNTIVNRDGKLYGYNTDYDGFLALARHAGVDFSGARVVILGAGGAAKAVAAAARSLGAASIVNAVRRPSKGQLQISDAESYRGCNIIVNATPVGMYPTWQDSPVDLPSLLPLMDLRGVLDCIYNPLRTRLVLSVPSAPAATAVPPVTVAARGHVNGRGPRERVGGMSEAKLSGGTGTAPAAEVPAEGGLYMLVAQAVKAREFFTGESITDEVIEREYRHLLHRKLNIVLCGMPSCGKSTVGRALADATGRRFVDTDEIIALQAGMEIPDIFEREGEDGFRIRETAAIESIAPEQGLIISTGGGAILKDENVRLLRHNGLICLLDRDLQLLTPGGGRPLSRNRAALEALYARRMPVYRRAAEVIIDNNGSLDATISQLLAYVD